MLSLTRPLNAQLEITDKCNFRCQHCYHLNFDGNRKSRDVSDNEIMAMAKTAIAITVSTRVKADLSLSLFIKQLHFTIEQFGLFLKHPFN